MSFRIRDIGMLPRWVKHQIQYLRWGFSDEDTWALDGVIARFVLPRLKRFKEIHNGFPDGDGFTGETWNEALDKMIYAMKSAANGYIDDPNNKTDWVKVEEGQELFGKYFHRLGW